MINTVASGWWKGNSLSVVSVSPMSLEIEYQVVGARFCNARS